MLKKAKQACGWDGLWFNILKTKKQKNKTASHVKSRDSQEIP